MAIQLDGAARVGGSPHRAATLTPQARRLLVAGALGALALGVFGWGIDSLFALMAFGLVLYGMVLVAVMRRELVLCAERS